MNQHPAEGARIIMQSDEDSDLAAVVAYEHHIMLNGGGYPSVHYNRACTLASRPVHVCDVSSTRSARGGRIERHGRRRRRWPTSRNGPASNSIPDLVTAFIQMLRQGEARVRVLSEETSI